MLVLSRKAGEEIAIDGIVSIRILSVERGIVRLGIEAPREVAVYRRELYCSVEHINRQAVATKPLSLVAALRGARLYAPQHSVTLPAVSLDKDP
ncbi:MAG: carbon storage regulator CsrA [Candidatus Kapabacteria bacterium]|nr:carbon storage regulator CsrA [Candidatus Kapabacteria bacterium]MCS7169945.1 carbon storage regulator CsrA [Candidatus Kapabacteria bacterium]MDW7997627.1 carbon storage regulator CsrA [Bacteroidota bacterium]